MSSSHSIDGWPEQFEDSDDLCFPCGMDEEIAEWWVDTIQAPWDLFPQQMWEDVRAGCPAPSDGVFRVIDIKGGIVSIEGYGREVSGDNIHWLYGHTLRFGRKNFMHCDMIGVEVPFRGYGTGRKLMKNCVNLAESLGAERVKLEAMDDGPYVWARMGFRPCTNDWMKTVRPAAYNRLMGLGRLIPRSTFQDVARLLRSKSAEAIWELARFRDPVPPNDPTPLGPQTIPLGRALLADSHARWCGSLILDDDVAMALFEEATEDL